MRRTLRARTPMIALAFIGIAVLFIASCSTNEVEIPGLTGPSGSRLFITIEASPDKLFIRGPNANPTISRLTLQLKNQLGEGVPNATIAVRIVNANGSEVAIGSLDHVTIRTDAAGFARVTYTAPSTAQQPVPVQVFIRAILTDPAYAFEVVSTHQLDLELQKAFDCVAGPGAPEISFTLTPAAPQEDQVVCFDAQTTVGTAPIISFTWDFGDGRTDSGSVACHTFTRTGIFEVTLFVVDANQNCVSFTQLVTVGESGFPTCSFTASPNPVNTDTEVIFNASASADADGTIASHSWNFGDGTTGRGEITSHSFNAEGAFTVTLTVTDNSGNETVCTQTITVTSGLPSCQFTINPAAPNTGETVTFDASASTDVDGGTLQFAWDFDGDGQFDDGTGAVDTFTYTTEGTFLVTLQVTDDEGNVVTCSQTVTVGSVPPTCGAIQISPNPAGVNDVITFDASASTDDGTIVSYTWNFGDNTSTTEADAVTTHAYTTSGVTFNGTLVLTDNDGNTTSCPFSVTISAGTAPTCNASFPPTADVGQLVNFSGSATDADGDPLTFNWEFGDGNEANTEDTTHTYQSAGTFPVVFTVTDSTGLQCTDGGDIVVSGLPQVSINNTSTIENSGIPLLFTVTLSEAAAADVTVNYTTSDGSVNPATAGVDYTAETSFITIPAGSTSGTIDIDVLPDALDEPNETMFVTLTGVSANAEIDTANDVGTGTINDDDP